MRDDFRKPGSVARREPWPWIVGGVLAAFVVVDLSMVMLAGRTFEGPDDPTYYKMGLAYDQQMAGRRQGWRVESNLPQNLQAGVPIELKARVLAADGRELEGRVAVRIGRPATRSQDFELTLPGQWTPRAGWWVLAYQLDGQPLDRVRVYIP